VRSWSVVGLVARLVDDGRSVSEDRLDARCYDERGV